MAVAVGRRASVRGPDRVDEHRIRPYFRRDGFGAHRDQPVVRGRILALPGGRGSADAHEGVGAAHRDGGSHVRIARKCGCRGPGSRHDRRLDRPLERRVARIAPCGRCTARAPHRSDQGRDMADAAVIATVRSGGAAARGDCLGPRRRRSDCGTSLPGRRGRRTRIHGVVPPDEALHAERDHELQLCLADRRCPVRRVAARGSNRLAAARRDGAGRRRHLSRHAAAAGDRLAMPNRPRGRRDPGISRIAPAAPRRHFGRRRRCPRASALQFIRVAMGRNRSTRARMSAASSAWGARRRYRT